MSIRTISLFSGCGGSDLALQQAGYEIVWANDIWRPACETYTDNLPNPKIVQGDIGAFSKFPKAELLVGCYPCQGFTQGGRRDWEDPRNFLYRQFDRVLRVVNPLVFIVENVNGMAFGINRELLENQLCRFRMAGYSVSWRVLNAKDYGVPQNRKRVFMVGIKKRLQKHYMFPDPTHGSSSTPFLTQKDVLVNLPPWPAGDFNDEPFHWYYLSRRRRYDWHEPSPCIVGHWRHVPLHPSSPPLRRVHTDKWVFNSRGRARRFSYPECALIQGFPRDFKWKHGTVRERFQMIGNAVPPPLFAAVLSGLSKIW